MHVGLLGCPTVSSIVKHRKRKGCPRACPCRARSLSLTLQRSTVQCLFLSLKARYLVLVFVLAGPVVFLVLQTFVTPWLRLRRCAFTCVGWQVTLCDPIWQVMPRNSRTSSRRGLYSALTLILTHCRCRYIL